MSIMTSKASVEWYSPPAIVELCREFMGRIDLDPASDPFPQKWIKAGRYYTEAEDGLSQPWFIDSMPNKPVKLFLNPPYNGQTSAWMERFTRDYENFALREDEALALINSAPGYKWFERLWRKFPVLMFEERLRFVRNINGEPVEGGQAKKGQCLVYAGSRPGTFSDHFRHLGRIIMPEV